VASVKKLILALTLIGCTQERDKLLAELQNTRPDIRALAVRKLAEKFDSDDLSVYTQAARDPVSIVRAEAMVALGRSQDSRVVDLLSDALGDSDEQVQINAAAALANMKTDKAKAYLTLQYARRGRSVRMAIVKALKGSNMPGATASVVAAEANTIWERNIKILVDGSPPERVAAAEELGRSGRPDAVNRLVPLLKEAHVTLASAAARGLGYAHDSRAVAALVPLLSQPDVELSESVAEALGAIGDNSVILPLVNLVKEKGVASSAAVRALTILPRTPESDAALCDLALSLDDGQMSMVARELNKRNHHCSSALVLEALKNQASQFAALRAFALTGEIDDAALSKVAALLASSDVSIRAKAAQTLGLLKKQSAIAALQKALENEKKTLEPLRADWITKPLPKEYAQSFHPDGALPTDSKAVQKMKTNDLFKKIQARDEKMAKELGKTLIHAQAPREFVDDGTEEQVQALAEILRALGRLKDANVLADAKIFATDASTAVRGAALTAMAFADQNVKEALFDSDRSLQSVVAQALVDSGAKGQTIVAQSAVELPADRSRLVEALRMSPTLSETVAPSLLTLVKEGGPETGSVALLLAELKSTEAPTALIEALQDPSLAARREVLLALGKFKSPQASEAIAQDLFSDSPDIRAAAATALVAAGDTAHAESLEALKADYYFKVREAAGAHANAPKGTP
jgi:HEAT repeat protein